jgi:glycosyltransferase involved in cell wall biosynthesis
MGYFLGINNRIASYRESRFQFQPSLPKKLFVYVSKLLITIFATRILSNSREAFEYFHPGYFGKEKFKIIFNSISKYDQVGEDRCREFLAEHEIPQDAFVVGHVGRFTSAKNHIMISKFIREINLQDDNVHFLLCGQGVKDGMNCLDSSLKNLHCIEYIESLNIFYNSLDLFYFPSLNEGQPNVLLESLSVGLPIIASDISVHRESVPKLLAPWLIPASDMAMTLSTYKKYRNNKLSFPSAEAARWVRIKYASTENFELFFNELKGNLQYD